MSPLPAVIDDLITYEPEECLLGSWEVTRFERGGGRSFFQRGGGRLVLTSNRLIYVEQSGHFSKKTFRVIPSLSHRLEEIDELSESTLPGGTHCVSISGEAYFISPLKGSVGEVLREVRYARGERQRLLASNKRGGTDAVLTREIVREVVKIPCQYCGNLVLMTAKQCDSCGAKLGAKHTA